MSFPRYERYKDSGVEWLGEVPEHWHVNRLKLIADVFPSNVDKKEYEGEISVRLCNYTDVYYNDVITDDMELMKATASEEQIAKFTLRSGDTIITKDSETADDIAISAFVPHNLPGVVCGYHLSVVRPQRSASGNFLKRLFDCDYVRAQVEVSANGLTRVGLSQYALDNLQVAYPDQVEQFIIANFIDNETAKLDTLIEEQRRLIELLKEKRQAVISHAVTKGLLANVAMKSSGFQWLGEIPKHWCMTSVRRLSKFTTSGPRGWSDRISEDGNLFVQSGDLDDSLSVVFAGCKRVTVDDDAEATRTRLADGDVVVCITGAKTGKVAVCSSIPEEAYVNQHLCLIRLNAKVLPRYLGLLLKSDVGRTYFDLSQYGLKQGLSLEDVRDAPVPLPSLAEQLEICEYIDSRAASFDSLTHDAAVTIEILQERRSALISAAVTGKVDVRAHMAKPVMSATQYSSGFAHQLLAAEILDRCNSQRMGRIKLQKLIHLCEYHGQVSEVQGDYSRKAAGPFDAKAMAGVRNGLKKQKWFEEVKEGERYLYQPLAKRGEHKKYLAHWEREMPRIGEVLNLLGNAKTRQCEIVSTLYAAWNDLLIDKRVTDDATILHEASSAERWHKSKEKIESSVWNTALQWMKDKGLVPAGYGKHTRQNAEPITEVANEPA